jgi:hypothetical protein
MHGAACAAAALSDHAARGLSARRATAPRPAAGQVAVDEVVGAGLVGHQVGLDAAALARRTSSGRMSAALPSRPMEMAFFSCVCCWMSASASSRSRGLLVHVARAQAEVDAALLALDVERAGAGQRGGQRLGAAHAAQAGGEDPLAREVAVVVLAAGLDEGLVGALHDALAADVDPAAGGHLAVHEQALAVEFVEVLPGGPLGHEVGVGQQHARRVGVRLEHAHGLAGLDEQGSSSFSSLSEARIWSKHSQLRAARPMPP